MTAIHRPTLVLLTATYRCSILPRPTIPSVSNISIHFFFKSLANLMGIFSYSFVYGYNVEWYCWNMMFNWLCCHKFFRSSYANKVYFVIIFHYWIEYLICILWWYYAKWLVYFTSAVWMLSFVELNLFGQFMLGNIEYVFTSGSGSIYMYIYMCVCVCVCVCGFGILA